MQPSIETGFWSRGRRSGTPSGRRWRRPTSDVVGYGYPNYGYGNGYGYGDPYYATGYAAPGVGVTYSSAYVAPAARARTDAS